MSKVIERCAGIDIGKRFLLCCALTGAAAEEPQSETLRFEVTVAALQEVARVAREQEGDPCGHGEHRAVLDSGI
jgi:hypothetical protein